MKVSNVAQREQLPRRRFLMQATGLAASACLPWPMSAADSPAPEQKLRAAIIGHTGHGDYGHDHDRIFEGLPNIEVVALADADPGGRSRAAERARAKRQYADYREMLAVEKPKLVCIAPRWTDEHHAMAIAALRVGAHVFLEKPITQTLAEADELLAVAKAAGLKIAVAHQMRLSPTILFLKRSLEDGSLGELLGIRAHGKQDHRAGGEDLMVLGVHLFDLMRCFAGDPLWCTARVLQNGHEVSRADAHSGTENIGPVAGDEISAQFAFPKGVNASFTSRARNREVVGPLGLELITTKGSIKILANIFPTAWQRKQGKWTDRGQIDEWLPLANDPGAAMPEAAKSVAAANRRVAEDWLAAIAQNREPICSGYAGMKALEMALAVFAAGLSRGRITFPLAERNHPLRA